MNKNSTLIIIVCAAAGFSGLCVIGGGLGLYLLLAGSGDNASVTTWADVLKERATTQELLQAEFQRVRDENKGMIPPAEYARLSIKVGEHDRHLKALEELATRQVGPPPPDVFQVVRRPLSAALNEELRRGSSGKDPSVQIVGGPQGAYPPGAFPPGAMPPGAVPFGAMPPGAMPPGAMPPGAMPPGAMPRGFGPPDPHAGIDVEAIERLQKNQIEGQRQARNMESQTKEADRIKTLVQGYYKNANPSQPRGEQPMVEAQRELVKEMVALELSLREKNLSKDERLALFEKQSDLEQSFRDIGAEEGRRLAVLKKEADEKERQRQEVLQKEAAEVARLAQEKQLREFARIDADARARANKAAEDHAKRIAESNREYDEKMKKAEMIRFMEAVNKQRAAQGLAPLTEILPSVTASIFDKGAAPGTEVKEVSDVKPKDKVFVHSAGKWHDAVVKTKRGKFIEVVHVALENLETVTVDRVRLQPKEAPKVAAKPAKVEAVPMQPVPMNEAVASEAKPMNEAVASEAKPMPAAPAADPFASTRTWSSSDGAFKVEAELIGFENGAAKLKRKDGRVINVPLDKLSPDDQSVVRDIYPEK